MNNEPLRVVGAAVALVQAFLTTIVLMQWVTLTPEQTAAWMGVVSLAGTFAVVLITRGKVTPIDKEKS